MISALNVTMVMTYVYGKREAADNLDRARAALGCRAALIVSGDKPSSNIYYFVYFFVDWSFTGSCFAGKRPEVQVLSSPRPETRVHTRIAGFLFLRWSMRSALAEAVAGDGSSQDAIAEHFGPDVRSGSSRCDHQGQKVLFAGMREARGGRAQPGTQPFVPYGRWTSIQSAA